MRLTYQFQGQMVKVTVRYGRGHTVSAEPGWHTACYITSSVAKRRSSVIRGPAIEMSVLSMFLYAVLRDCKRLFDAIYFMPPQHSLQWGHYVFTLSVVLFRCPSWCLSRANIGFPAQRASHDGRKPARCPCGWAYACASVDSPASSLYRCYWGTASNDGGRSLALYTVSGEKDRQYILAVTFASRPAAVITDTVFDLDIVFSAITIRPFLLSLISRTLARK